MSKVTAETITPVQIRELMKLGDTPLTGNGFVAACRRALDKTHVNRVRDRERCAEVWNARHGDSRG